MEAESIKGSQKTKAPRKIFYGWWIVLAGFATGYFSSGAFFFGFSAFFNPIVVQFGWSHAVTSIAFSIQRTETGVIGPFVGTLVDRFGPRYVMVTGGFLMGLGFILLSRINSLWQFYGAFALMALGMSFGTFLVTTTSVSNWFQAKRGRALAVLSAGSGLGGTLVPLIVLFIAILNWRGALVLLGLMAWVVIIPSALVMRSRPEDYGYLPDGREPDAAKVPGGTSQRKPDRMVGAVSAPSESKPQQAEVEFTVREALYTRAFWQLALAMSLAQLTTSAITVHMIPALESFDISTGLAGFVVMFVALTSIIGRLGGGILGDFIDKRYVLAASLAALVAGTLMFARITSVWYLIPFILLYGIGFGGSIPVRFALMGDYFGRRSFGSLLGVTMTINVVFGVVAPVFAGWMFDVTDSYRPAFIILGLVSLAAPPLMLSLRRPILKQRI